MALRKYERNALMESLLKGGLKAADLTLGEAPQPYLLRIANESGGRLVDGDQITHKPTDSVFTFYALPADDFAGEHRSGDLPIEEWKAQNWSGVLSRLAGWAADTAEWESTPDLWALDAAALPDAADNSLFIQAERDEIAKRLEEISDYVREKFELSDDQVAAIGQAVEELKEASERVGRKDWKLMFYGAFVSLGLAQALSSGVVDVVFRLGVEGFGHIFGAGGPPMITA